MTAGTAHARAAQPPFCGSTIPDRGGQLYLACMRPLQAMRASPYIGPFEERLRSWEARMNTTQVGRSDDDAHPPAVRAVWRWHLPAPNSPLHLLAGKSRPAAVPSCVRPGLQGHPLLLLFAGFAGHLGCVAGLPAVLVVPGAHFGQRGHHAPDAQRGPQVQGGGRHLAPHHGRAGQERGCAARVRR